MSAKIVVSGNQTQKIPTEVSVKTSSYTIPVGKYCRIVVNVVGTGAFFINGSLSLQGQQWTVLGSDNLSTRVTQNNFFGNPIERGLITVGTSNGTPSFGTGSGFNESTAFQSHVAEFILPSGTVISGSGTWRAVVEEYEE